MNRLSKFFAAAFAAFGLSACGDVDLTGQLEGIESLVAALLDDGQTVLGLRILDADGEQEERNYFTDNPIRIGLVFEGAPEVQSDQILIGLIEEHAADISAAERSTTAYRSCRLGGFQADHVGGSLDSLGVLYLESEFTIPADCIPDDANELTMNLWVGVNPQMVTTAEDAANSEEENHNSTFYNEWFLKNQAETGEGDNESCFLINGDDVENWSATNLPLIDGSKGCVVSLRIQRSPGPDMSLTELGSESSVAFIDISGGEFAGEETDISTSPVFADLEDQPDLPTSDEVGGPTFIQLEGTYEINGVSSEFDPLAGDELPSSALEKVLKDGEKVEIQFEICPAELKSEKNEFDIDVELPTGECATGTEYLPLFVRNTDEATTADTPYLDGQEITDGTTGVPNGFNADIVLGEDTETFFTLSATSVSVDDEIQDWTNDTSFLVKACIVTPFTEVSAGQSNVDTEANNCRVRDIVLRRGDPSSEPGAALSELRRFEYGDDTHVGTSILGGRRRNILNTVQYREGNAANALKETWITGWLSVRTEHQHIYANGRFGQKPSIDIMSQQDVYAIWQVAKVGTKFEAEDGHDSGVKIEQETPQVYKGVCADKEYGIAGVGASFSFCAGIIASVKAFLSVSQVKDNTGREDSIIRLNAGPFGRVGVEASGSANLLVVSVGVYGHAHVASIFLGLEGWNHIAKFGNGAIHAGIGVSFKGELKYMDINIGVYVDTLKPAWCGCGSWCPGYPCSSWSRIYTNDLIKWSAVSFSGTIATLGNWKYY